MRVFWPTNCLDIGKLGDESLFVGWINPGGDIVVVTALPCLEAHLVAKLLAQDGLLRDELAISHAKFLESVFRSTLKNGSSKAHHDKRSHATRTASQLYAKFNQQRLCIVGSNSEKQLKELDSIYEREVTSECILVRTNRNGMSLKHQNNPYITDCNGDRCVVVLFEPPDPRRMHYFTLEKANVFATRPKKISKHNLEKELKFHASSSPTKTDNWEILIPQLNCVHDLQEILRRNAETVFPELRDDPNLIKKYTSGERMQQRSEFKVLSTRSRSKSFIQPRLKGIQLAMTIRSAIELCLKFLETAYVGRVSLTSSFCTAQQIDLRLNQLCYLPHEYIAITRRSQQDWHWLTPDRNEAYIRFNNYLWLGTNDLIFGTYLCTLLSANAEEIAIVIGRLKDALCENFITSTHWLMAWPAGLKLNTQLAQFMGEITIWIIVTWYKALSSVLTPAIMKSAISLIALSGMVGGATLQISLFIDLFSTLTFHLSILYQLFARVYLQQCNVLLSLFRVFRGLKYNELRRRVDHGDFDVHQLLLGTILFTVVLFLFPTVLVFYVVFALARIAVLGVIGLLCMGLAFLNYFPLFPLLLRIKSPRRVPSGLTFELVDHSSPCSVLRVKTKSMALSEIFSQYLDATSLFMRDALTIDMVKELCTGRIVNIQQSKLYSSLYSMLPSRRGSGELLFSELSDYLNVKQSAVHETTNPSPCEI